MISIEASAAIGSAAISAASLYISRLSYCASREAAVAAQMKDYLLEYAKLQDDFKEHHDDPLSASAYSNMNNLERARVQIVVGLLIGLVEAMKRAGDRRADTWFGFISAIPGPFKDLSGFDPSVYASKPDTKRKLAAIKRRLKAG